MDYSVEIQKLKQEIESLKRKVKALEKKPHEVHYHYEQKTNTLPIVPMHFPTIMGEDEENTIM